MTSLPRGQRPGMHERTDEHEPPPARPAEGLVEHVSTPGQPPVDPGQVQGEDIARAPSDGDAGPDA